MIKIKTRILLMIALCMMLSIFLNKEITKAQTTEPFKINTLDPTQKTPAEAGSKTDSETGSETDAETGSETVSEDDQKVRILFIGNSHTFYNHMPYMVQGLASGAGINCEVKVIAEKGCTLVRHADPEDPQGAKVYEALRDVKWDYVVLQEHRRNLVRRRTRSRQAFQTLCDEIEKNGAQAILYIPHSEKIGGYFRINGNRVYLTNYQIDDRLSRNGYQLANPLNVRIADYSLNNMLMRIQNPRINLYKSDKLHPSVNGSYLAACTIFATIFDKSPYRNPYLPGSKLDQDGLLKSMRRQNAILIQNLADSRLVAKDNYVIVDKGESGTLSASFTCDNPRSEKKRSNQAIYWSSVNPNAISVNSVTGQFTALATGKYLVKAYTESGLSTYITVQVVDPEAIPEYDTDM